MSITFKHLRVFMEVVNKGTMVGAAAALHISPPAVTMQINELEAHVGLTLFDRNKRKVSLSPAGEYFVVYARRMLANLKETENAMARFKQLDHGFLNIGIVSSAAYFVPRLLARFHEEYPGIDLKLRVIHGREQLMTLIANSEVDLLVMDRPNKELSAARAETFATNPLVFVCPPGHPLMHTAHLSVEALDGHGFIMRDKGARMRDLMDTFLAEHRCTPQMVMEASSTETIKHAVMAGMGIAFLSLHTIALELRHGLMGVLDIRDTPLRDVWTIVHLDSRILSPAAEAFRYFMIEQGENEIREYNSTLLSLAFKRSPAEL